MHCSVVAPWRRRPATELGLLGGLRYLTAMAWLRAELRGNNVFARANDQAELHIESGRVEIRYNRNDGRAYRAAARNLTVIDATLLPDDYCGEAEPVAAAATKSAKTKAKKKKKKYRTASAVDHLEIAPTADQVVAYTDGACSGNPGPAGLGVVILDTDERVELSEHLGEATNNIAELTAILRVLQTVDEERSAVIHTDSQYAIGVLQKGWKAKANKPLIEELRAAMQRPGSVRLVYVKGHAGIPLNERADELARRAVSTCENTRDVEAVSGNADE